MSSVFDVVYWWSVADQQRRQECNYEMTAHQRAVQTDSMMARVSTADKSTMQQLVQVFK